VPEAAIVHEGTDSFLVTVDGESHARRRLIEVGMTSGGEAEILSGLSPGESVIVQGHEGLPDGAEVTTSGSCTPRPGRGSRAVPSCFSRRCCLPRAPCRTCPCQAGSTPSCS